MKTRTPSKGLPEKPFQTLQLARYALGARFESIPTESIGQLKRHVLDSLGSYFFSLGHPTFEKMRRSIAAASDSGPCALPGIRGRFALDRAAELATAAIRYPDFMDNFLGKEATCHPCDNLGGLLAAASCTGAGGREFLTALAVAYEMECRLVEEIPVMVGGFDHTTLLAYSLTSGIGRLLGLDELQLANAIAIAGASANPLVVSRASYTYEWKGFASALSALNVVNAVFCAREGVTGPISLFENERGFDHVLGFTLDYDWTRDRFELLRRCILKSHNAEVHTQTAIEAALDLREGVKPSEIAAIDIRTFAAAYHITGGGAYGDRKDVHSKEQADHSLPYVVAVALLDGEVYPEQFEPTRIENADVQALLRKVNVGTYFPLHRPFKLLGALDPLTIEYPRRIPTRVTIKLEDGRVLSRKRKDYPGFHTRPLDWPAVERKFRRLSSVTLDSAAQDRIIAFARDLENRSLAEFPSWVTEPSETRARGLRSEKARAETASSTASARPF